MKCTIHKYINLNELIFDLIITFIASRMYILLARDEGIPLTSLSYSTARYLVLIVEFAIAFFLGKLAQSYMKQEFSSNFKNIRVRSLLYGITSIYILFMIYISLPPLLNASGFLTYIFGLIVIVFGVIAGMSSWAYNEEETHLTRITQNKQNKNQTVANSTQKDHTTFFQRIHQLDENISYKEHPILIILPVVTLLYTIIMILGRFRRTTGIKGLLIVLMAIIAGITALYISGLICILIINAYNAIKRNFHLIHYSIVHILYPAAMAFFIITWNNLYLHATINATAHANPVFVLFLLIITGIIPMRIFIAFEPPVRYINIIISIGALFYFIASILF